MDSSSLLVLIVIGVFVVGGIAAMAMSSRKNK
jgi:hypothetical protein